MRVIDDTVETVNSFIDKIMRAKIGGDTWIETDRHIINHYNRNGLGMVPYFIYQGIKVYETGTKEACDKEENMQLGRRLHGSSEGLVEGR